MTDPASHFGDWQYGIYLRGMGMGERPELPDGVGASWRRPRATSSTRSRAATSGAARARATRCARTSRPSARWRIVPRHAARRSTTRDLAVQVLGIDAAGPGAARADRRADDRPPGRRAGQRRAARRRSACRTSPARRRRTRWRRSRRPAGRPRWYQLYWPKDDAICESLVRRAEEAGYTAIVVTLDTFFLGWRPADLAQGLPAVPARRGRRAVLQRPGLPVASSRQPPEEDVQAAVGHWVSVVNRVVTVGRPRVAARDHRPADRPQGRPAPRRCPPGARRRHGRRGRLQPRRAAGRRGDRRPGRAARGGRGGLRRRLTVLFDCGIRCGADVVKALALGADAVLIGRPFLWGLALAGADGVEHVLRMLLAELDLTMALSGAASVADLSPALLTRG